MKESGTVMDSGQSIASETEELVYILDSERVRNTEIVDNENSVE